MVGQTLTAHFQIETRQYEILNIDLGEGVPRRLLGFGAVICVIWWILCAVTFRGMNQVLFSVYFIPPILLSYFGFQDSRRHPRRKNLTEWLIKGRRILTGHRPIIALGARPAYRNEYLTLRERADVKRLRNQAIPWDIEEAEQPEAEVGLIQTGPTIRMDQTAQIVGFDYMQALRERTKS